MDKLGNNKEEKPSNDDKLSSSLVADWFERNQEKLNKNEDKYLSREELTKGILKNRLSPTDTKIACAVLDNLHDIELLHNDEWGTERSGITKDDIKEFNRKVKAGGNDLTEKIDASLKADEHNPQKFKSIANIYWPNMDKDRSGGLDKEELEDYIATTKDPKEAKAVAALMLEHFEDFNSLGSKHSAGSYKGLLPRDNNEEEISKNEVTSMAQIAGSTADFKQQARTVRNGVHNDSAFDRTINYPSRHDGPGTSIMKAIVQISAHEREARSNNTCDSILDDYEDRKKIVQAWNFFK